MAEVVVAATLKLVLQPRRPHRHPISPHHRHRHAPMVVEEAGDVAATTTTRYMIFMRQIVVKIAISYVYYLLLYLFV